MAGLPDSRAVIDTIRMLHLRAKPSLETANKGVLAMAAGCGYSLGHSIRHGVRPYELMSGYVGCPPSSLDPSGCVVAWMIIESVAVLGRGGSECI